MTFRGRGWSVVGIMAAGLLAGLGHAMPAGATSNQVVSVGSVTIAEGDTGIRTVNVPITLNRPATSTVSVQYALVDGTATGGRPGTAGADFDNRLGKTYTAKFRAGQTVKYVPIRVFGDGLAEPSENFYVVLSHTGPGLSLGDSVGSVTIRDDDPSSARKVSVDDASIVEGDSGSRKMLFAVRLTTPAPQKVTVDYRIVPETATGGYASGATPPYGTDFADGFGATKTLVFSAGRSGTAVQKVIPVTVFGDTAQESNEQFRIELMNVTGPAELATESTGVGTIIDDESVSGSPIQMAPLQVYGVPVAGQTLVASTGVWDWRMGAVTYRWDACEPDLSDCMTRKEASVPTYTTLNVDAGKLMRVQAVITTPTGTYSSEPALALDAVSAVKLPTVNHCGTISRDETWLPGSVHVLTCDVSTGSFKLTVAAGAIVKTDGSSVIRESTGSVVRLAGTDATPVVVTDIRDDSVGGDSNGDGASSTPADAADASGGFIQGDCGGTSWCDQSGTLSATNTRFQWIRRPISGYLTAVTVARSEFRFSDTTAGAAVSVNAASSGFGFTDNQFGGVSLRLNSETISRTTSLPVRRNVFRSASVPFSARGGALTNIALSGSDANSFYGVADQKRVDLDYVLVPSGTTVRLAAGPVYHLYVKADGVVNVDAGAILKVNQGSTAFAVGSGGEVHLKGSSTAPIVVTDWRDDTAGGDTNADGSATSPAPYAYSGGVWLASSGDVAAAVDVSYVHFSWIYYPVDADASAVQIDHSEFTEPATETNYDGGWVFVRGAAGSGITDNRFEGVRLAVRDSSVPIARNTFQSTSSPLSLVRSDLSKVVFAGSDSNVFLGVGPQRRVVLWSTFVPPSATATLGAGGPVFEIGTCDWCPGNRVVGTLNILPGAIVKSHGYGLEAVLGGTINAIGTEAEPIIVTAWWDDSVGGDTNGDGASPPPFHFRGVALDARSASTIRVQETQVHHVELAASPMETSASVSVHQTTFTDADISLENVAAGDGIADNQFFGRSHLRVIASSVPVMRNEFHTDGTDAAMEVVNSDLVSVPFVGASANTFDAKSAVGGVRLFGAKVPPSTEVKLPAGPVFSLCERDVGGAFSYLRVEGINVLGTLDVEPGAVLKFCGGPSSPRPWTGLDVEAGGALNLSGSADNPVVLTVSEDDTVGGDTNGDGSQSVPTATKGNWDPFRPTGVRVETGATASIDHTEIRWIGTALHVKDGGSASMHATLRNVYMGVNNWNGTDGSFVNATGSDWGDPSGPAPWGSGAAVSGNVAVFPWVGYQPPTISTSLPTGSSTASPCDQVVIIGARGSGESPQGGEAPDYGITSTATDGSAQGFGTPGWFAADRIASRLAAQGISTRRYGLKYPALPMPWDQAGGNIVSNSIDYAASINAGVMALAAKLIGEAQQCPSSPHRVVLVGYSQGALVIHLTSVILARANTATADAALSQIAGVALIADPGKVAFANETLWELANTPAGSGVVHSYGVWSQGMLATKGALAWADGSVSQLPNEIVGETVQICHNLDVVCNGVAWGNTPDQHTNYWSSETYALGDAVADRVLANR